VKALLLIAHGSRVSTSNDEVLELRRRLAERLGTAFDRVDCAFLELASPSMEQAIDDCIAQGCHALTLLPYFLTAGRHISTDIPAIVTRKQAQFPQVSIHMAPYLGQADELIETLAGLALGR